MDERDQLILEAVREQRRLLPVQTLSGDAPGSLPRLPRPEGIMTSGENSAAALFMMPVLDRYEQALLESLVGLRRYVKSLKAWELVVAGARYADVQGEMAVDYVLPQLYLAIDLPETIKRQVLWCAVEAGAWCAGKRGCQIEQAHLFDEGKALAARDKSFGRVMSAADELYKGHNSDAKRLARRHGARYHEVSGTYLSGLPSAWENNGDGAVGYFLEDPVSLADDIAAIDRQRTAAEVLYCELVYYLTGLFERTGLRGA